jgi:hypothetical protein
LHAFDCPGLCILAGLTAALSFNCTLPNEISGRIALEVGGPKLLDAPALFFVEFIAHDLGELFELAL